MSSQIPAAQYRALIAIPTGPADVDQIVVGAVPVGPGYPKQYRPDDFRAWAADLDALHAAMAADPHGQYLADLLDQSPDLRRSHNRYFGDPSDGIRGSLVPIQGEPRVVLDGGRHRAFYQMERGYAYTPVWVSADSRQALDEFRETCSAAMRTADPALARAYDIARDRSEERTHTREGREAPIDRRRHFERGEFER